MTKLLIVDDEKRVRDAVRLALMGEDFTVTEAETPDQAYALIQSGNDADSPDLVLLDVHFPAGVTCHALLARLKAEDIPVPVVVLSGAASAKEAADAVRLGAYDFIEKPVSADRLRVTLGNALASAGVKAALKRVTVDRNVRHQLVGHSPGIRAVQKLISQFGPKDVKVLITGETGTGKEVVAHALWQASARAKQPLIIVNAAAIPETLVESELFGHRRGAFTGAVSNQMGKIEMADHGTLFLDEIGELSIKAQVKLLRFLETGEIQVLGSNQIRRCDVRLITATSRDLPLEIKAGRFREDLYFRLNVAAIPLPPLRQRGADINLLFDSFLASFCRRYDEPARMVSADAALALLAHSWPGNVRELRNVAERAALLAEGTVTADVLRPILGPSAAPALAADLPGTLDEVLPLKDYRRRHEMAYIAHVVKLAGGSVARAAQVLGVDRSHLHAKLRDGADQGD